MIFDDPTQTGSASAPMPGIFTRILTATTKAQHVRSCMDIKTPPVVFLGEQEWQELRALCETFDMKWSASEITGYFPAENEATRAEFGGFKIYRVDAKSFIAAL